MDRAQASHKKIWLRASNEEKLTLIHLAVEGLVACNDPELRRLMKQGLIVRDARLRLMDESFRRFVIAAAENENVSAWEKDGRSSLWQILKVPFILVLAILGLFLFITQKEIFDSTMAMVTD